MGRVVIVGYRPKAGAEGELLELLLEHLPTLRRRGLATNRPGIRMRAADGTVLEVFEWESVDAIARAHEDPEVQAMWERFAGVCDYVPVGTLPEAGEPFPEFEGL